MIYMARDESDDGDGIKKRDAGHMPKDGAKDDKDDCKDKDKDKGKDNEKDKGKGEEKDKDKNKDDNKDKDKKPQSNGKKKNPWELDWFKIYHEGYEKKGGDKKEWAVQRMYNAGGWVNFTVPKCIPSGEYLARFELIGAFTPPRGRICSD
jgi:hypothetical protein